MRFKLDENMPVVVAEILRDSGYDAETVYGEAISGINDPELLDAVLVAVRRWLLAAAESPPRPGALRIVSNNRIRVRTTPNPD